MHAHSGVEIIRKAEVPHAGKGIHTQCQQLPVRKFTSGMVRYTLGVQPGAAKYSQKVHTQVHLGLGVSRSGISRYTQNYAGTVRLHNNTFSRKGRWIHTQCNQMLSRKFSLQKVYYDVP